MRLSGNYMRKFHSYKQTAFESHLTYV